jgi:long-chain fatty acid transport protein
MGGTAIAFADDASAVFHNPAGISRVRGLDVLANVSLLFGSITTSPGNPDSASSDGTYPSRTTRPVIAPLFMLGVAYRITERVGVGVALFPVASAAGEYRNMNIIGNPTIDKTRLVFVEVSPAVSVRLAPRLSLAVGYRATLTTLERVKGDLANPREFNFRLSGTDFYGVRAGLQWQATDHLGFGLVYRHKITPTLRADRAFAYSQLSDAQTTLVLPSKLGAGAAVGANHLRVAVDVEYTIASQNDRTTLSGFNPALDKMEQVTNYFVWQDGVTGRLGVEYALGRNQQFAIRGGYVYDGQVSNKAYPSAFGTPPAASHSLGIGGGYRTERWQVNIASVYRLASTKIAPADTAGAMDCATCSEPGPEYSLRMLGVYLDCSFKFDPP